MNNSWIVRVRSTDYRAGPFFDLIVNANSLFQARALVENQYGKGSIFNIYRN